MPVVCFSIIIRTQSLSDGRISSSLTMPPRTSSFTSDRIGGSSAYGCSPITDWESPNRGQSFRLGNCCFRDVTGLPLFAYSRDCTTRFICHLRSAKCTHTIRHENPSLTFHDMESWKRSLVSFSPKHDRSANLRFASRASCTASCEFSLTSSSVAPGVFAAGDSSTNRMEPFGTGV